MYTAQAIPVKSAPWLFFIGDEAVFAVGLSLFIIKFPHN